MRLSPVQSGVMGTACHLTTCTLGVKLDRDQLHPRLPKAVLQRADLRVQYPGVIGCMGYKHELQTSMLNP